jgi:hypothetical protein
MALIESAGGAWATSNTNIATTGAFTPNAGALLVAICAIGNGGNAVATGITITDSVSGTWTPLVTEVVSPNSLSIVAVKDAGASPASQTVTATGATTGAQGVGLIVRQFAGAAPVVSQNGATAVYGVTGSSVYTINITPIQTGSQVVGAFGTSTNSYTMIANASTSIYNQANGSALDTEVAFEATSLSTAGSQMTLGFTNGGTSSNIFALAEILPGVAPAGHSLITSQAVKRGSLF